VTIEDIKQNALTYLLRYGSHSPVIYASGTKNDSILVLNDLPDDQHQSRVSLFTKGMDLAKTGHIGTLRELFLTSEAWVRKEQPGERKHTAPQDDPQREEALVVYSLDIVTKQQQLFLFTILRDKQGVAREITPYQGREELQAVSNPFLLTFLAGYASIALFGKKRRPVQ
jgi:hypothetical protein